MKEKILVTGAGGEVGSVSNQVIKHLRDQGYPVRAFFYKNDQRTAAVEKMGAEIFKGDLLNLHDAVAALNGVTRVYFSMSLSPYYADSFIVMMAAMKQQGNIKAVINLSEYEQTFMTFENMKQEADVRRYLLGGKTDDWSPQQRAHWVSQRALEWSGLPVINVYADLFMENPILSWLPLETVAKQGVLELPFGDKKLPPIAATDLAEAVANLLAKPEQYIGKSLTLTGDQLVDENDLAALYSEVLGKEITSKNLPIDEWVDKYISVVHAAHRDHEANHLENLGRLTAGGMYEHTTTDLEDLLGHQPRGLKYALEHNARVQEVKAALNGQAKG